MKKVIKVMSVLGVMACIFYLSSQTATDSRALSNKVLEELNIYFERLKDWVPYISSIHLNGFVLRIRKVAHFTIYMVLGFVSYWAMPRRWSVKKKIGFVMTLCCLYAISDEFHQHFVPGRAPEVRDVLIDTFGSSVGMSIGCILKRFK